MVEQQQAEGLAKIVVGRDLADLKHYGTQGTLFIGKHLVGTGEEAHVTTPVLLDALRPHIIVLTGKRGEGKCLTPETPVALADGTTKDIDKIFKEIAAGREDHDKEEEIFPCIGVDVLTVDKELNVKPKQISHVYRKKVSEKLLKITTKRSRTITCTKEHPLLTIEESLVWKMASELKENVAVGALQTSLQSTGGTLLKSYILSWDEIAKVEEIDYVGYVYDLTVPETHNFVAGVDGIVCHNSYSMGVFMEELQKTSDNVRKNLCSVVIDTQGIFWTMKSPNEKDAPLLKEWQLSPTGFTTFVYVPEGQRALFEKSAVAFDGVFSIGPDELSAEDWLYVFELDPNAPLGIILQRTINKLRESGARYTIDAIMEVVGKTEGFESERLALQNRFEAAKGWGIFGSARMPLLLDGGRLSILDISVTPQNVRALLVSLISRKIFEERTVARRKEELAETEGIEIKRTPMCWIFIDEAHNFVPDEGHPASMDIILKMVREGRQPGITLVMATQRPEKLHPDALAQTDMIISHRLTAKGDIDALRAIMQTYMLYDIAKYINDLPKLKGVALILDDNSERLYTTRIRPRQSWHAGASPVAI